MNREELLKNAKPILFNTEMVQAITEGRKTVTRRVVKLKNGYSLEGKGKEITENINLFGDDIIFRNGEETNETLKPQYKVGDILYVRETWSFISCDECKKSESHTDFNSTGCGISAEKKDYYKDNCGCYVYRTNYGTTEDDSFPPSMFKWRPSIHMPKSAARIFLKVTDVRVERLQDMTDEDCIAEGIKPVRVPGSTNYREEREFQIACGIATIEKYEELWDSTIKKQDLDKYGWKSNPWVWVVEFELEDIGKTVFLTREEAENKIKEVRKWKK